MSNIISLQKASQQAKAYCKPTFSKDGYYSQTGEDYIIEAIILQLGITGGYLVDIGAHDGFNLSNTRRLLNQGWNGILIDGNGHGNPDVNERFISASNVNEVLKELGCPDEPDLLSLDIDGQEWWVLQAMQVRPKVVVVEFNGGIGVGMAVTVPKDDSFVHDLTDYYGCSLLALTLLMKQKGYTLVLEHSSLNAFFVRNDVNVWPQVQPIHQVSRGFPADQEGRPWVDVWGLVGQQG